MASNEEGYTTTNFSIFTDLLPPPTAAMPVENPQPPRVEFTPDEVLRFRRAELEAISLRQQFRSTPAAAATAPAPAPALAPARRRGRPAGSRGRASSARRTRDRGVVEAPTRLQPQPQVLNVEAETQPQPQVLLMEAETDQRQPQIMGDGGNGTGDVSCPICFCPFHEPCTTICGHIFCRLCIIVAIDEVRKCPICRTKLTRRNKLIRVYLP